VSSPSVRALPLWKRFIAGSKPALKTRVRDELAAVVTDPQVAELVDLCGLDVAPDTDAAIRVLIKLPRERMSASARAKWLECLLRLARKHYTHDDLGALAFAALRLNDPEAAEQLLVTELDYDALTVRELPSVITDLSVSGSARALARLELLAEKNDRARLALEQKTGITRSAAERLAADWRATHRLKPLSDLYWKHITHLPTGASARDLLALLGEPSSTIRLTYYYQPVDSDVVLVLQEDAEGRLVTWKLKE